MFRHLLFLLIVLTTSLHYSYAQYSIKTHRIDSNLYLYTSYGDAGNYKNIDANAVVVVSGQDALIFDTPWDSTQAEQLVAWVEDSLHKHILLSVITHAHADRIGSIAVMHKHNIPTYSYILTTEEAEKAGYPAPKTAFYNTDTTFRCGNIEIIAYYPGAGHTVDNTVLYIPSKKFLYGGCFIKSGFSNNIGNIADADVDEWPKSVQRLQQRFGSTGFKMVIPGHGTWQSDNAIENTLRLLEKERANGY